MKVFHVRPLFHSVVVLSAAFVVAASFFSCKRVYMPPLTIDETMDSSGEILAATRFPSFGEIESLFHAILPDSGIVPVEVVVKNSGDRRLFIHHSNGLDLPEGYVGVGLNAGGVVFHPITPVEVFAAVKNIDVGGFKYRAPNVGRVLMGTMVAPYGGFLIYNELKYGRLYRALRKNSLFPVNDSGLFEPIVLDPGETLKGYIYFDLPSRLNPYACADSLALEKFERLAVRPGRKLSTRTGSPSEKKRKGRKELMSWREDFLTGCAGRNYELELRACFSVSGSDSLPYLDVRKVRSGWSGRVLKIPPRRWKGRRDVQSVLGEEWFMAISPSGGVGRGMKFHPVRFSEAVGGAPPGRKRGPGGDSFVGNEKGFYAKVLSRSAGIADCAMSDGKICGALNFKSSSTLFVWDVDGGVRLLCKKRLNGKVKRVFIDRGNVIALSGNFLFRFKLEGLENGGKVRAGRDICDAVMVGDTIYALQENGILKMVDLSSSGPMRVEIVDTLPAGRAEMLGPFGGGIVLLRPGGGYSFSLLYLEPGAGTFEELALFHGAPAYSEFMDGRVFIQFANGVFVNLGLREGGAVEVLSSGYVPFAIEAASYLEEGLCLIGEGGVYTMRPPGDYEPGSIEILTFSVPVAAPGIQER